jgi:MarR family transcriptional regulator for hemolysin
MNPISPFVNTLHRWIGVVMHNSMRNLSRYARERGFSMSQLIALNHINRKGPCGVTDFGEEMGISSPAASQMIDRLAQQGLIARTEDPSDRRSKLVDLTTEAHKILEESLQARQGWLADLEAALTADEQALAVQVLDLLTEKARQLEPPIGQESELHTPS